MEKNNVHDPTSRCPPVNWLNGFQKIFFTRAEFTHRSRLPEIFLGQIYYGPFYYLLFEFTIAPQKIPRDTLVRPSWTRAVGALRKSVTTAYASGCLCRVTTNRLRCRKGDGRGGVHRRGIAGLVPTDPCLPVLIYIVCKSFDCENGVFVFFMMIKCRKRRYETLLFLDLFIYV